MDNDRGVDIVLDGRKYTLVLTTRAAKEISGRYGGLDKFCDVLMSDDVGASLTETAWLLALLANQGILVHNLKNNDNIELLTAEAIETLTTPYELSVFSTPILEAYFKGMRRSVESEAGALKNAIAGGQ